MPPTYDRHVYEVPRELEEVVVAELWAAGTLGVETVEERAGSLLVAAWFDASIESVGVSVPRLRSEVVPAADWLADYRAGVKPFALGARFFVDPREVDAEPVGVPSERVLLRLPARTAFGIGSHESTRLALELLEETPLANCSVLDVGTGTGILAFVALVLGARLAVGFDLDPEAAFVARDNALLNSAALSRRRPGIYAGTMAALSAASRFDVIVVNVIPREVEAELPAIVRALAPGGALIFSGILVEQGDEVRARLAKLGLDVQRFREDGEWIAFAFSSSGAR